MTIAARTYAYLAALLMAFGSVTPWMQVNGEPGGASPLGLGTMLVLTGGILAATIRRRRSLLGLLAVAAVVIAVDAIWVGAGSPLVRITHDDPSAAVPFAGGGLSMIVGGATLLYVASLWPAPRTRPGAAGSGDTG